MLTFSEVFKEIIVSTNVMCNGNVRVENCCFTKAVVIFRGFQSLSDGVISFSVVQPLVVFDLRKSNILYN